MRRSPLNYEKKQTKVKELTEMLKIMLLVPQRFFLLAGRYLSFDKITNVIFAPCFTLRGHDTHIDFRWFCSGRQDWPSDPNLTLFVAAK